MRGAGKMLDKNMPFPKKKDKNRHFLFTFRSQYSKMKNNKICGGACMNPLKKTTLGIQHLFAMFGATVLVPTLTGLNVSVALVCAGIGTLIFHFITAHKVPVFLGSSFAFIAAIQSVCINGNPVLLEKLSTDGLSAVITDPLYTERIPYALGGIVFAGVVYVALSLIVKLVGAERVRSFFPPVVTGPVIVVIGLTLAPTGISMASSNWIIALVVLVTIIVVSVFCKGFFKLVPILIGLALGYGVSLICDGFHLFSAPLVNLDIIKDAAWINPFWSFNGEFFVFPKFELQAILMIAPVALVTFMEHIGDITTNGSVVGKDFFKDPGLHRTLLGDGVATLVAGFLGGPANTTYSENTGVLAVTKVYDTVVLKIAAGFAIVLGLFGKFGGVLQAIPDAVKGGMSIILFGMIAAIGMRTLAEAELDFTHSRNLIIVALVLVFGLGLSAGATTPAFNLFGLQVPEITFSGLFIAVLAGALANKVLPKNV